MTYSGTTLIRFKLNTYFTKNEVTRALSSVTFTKGRKPGAMGKRKSLCRKMWILLMISILVFRSLNNVIYNARSGWRSSAGQSLVLLSYGGSTDKYAPYIKRLKAKGIIVQVVAIGV